MSSPPLPTDLAEELKLRARTSPWLAYPLTAVPKILPWHESRSHYRVLSGPNGGGKSTAGAADFVSYPLGYNPIRDEEYTVPNVSWAVCIEYNSSGRVMFRKISDMLPRKPNGSPKWKYYKQEHLFVLENGSQIAIKSQKEGESSLLAERCRAIWVDEAMGGERGAENFGELQARGLPDEPLDMLFTLTPKLDTGLEWMKRKLWCEPGQKPHDDFIEGTFCLRFDLNDCAIANGGFHTAAYIADREAKTDPDEREARILGLWTPFMSRPAFSHRLLQRAMERTVRQAPVRWIKVGFNRYELEECDGGPNRMQRQRETAHNYIAFWDPSSGLGRGHDPSALSIFDRSDLCEVFHASSQDLGPDQFFREIVYPAATYYNDALLAIERNGQGGGAAVEAARQSNYNNLYLQKNASKRLDTYTDQVGWMTTDQSRNRMMDALQRALQEDKWTPSRDLIEQMATTVKKLTGSGKVRIEHGDGHHDDHVLAAAGALAIHYEEPVYDWPDFNTLRVQYGGTPYTETGYLLRS